MYRFGDIHHRQMAQDVSLPSDGKLVVVCKIGVDEQSCGNKTCILLVAVRVQLTPRRA